jgi:hypothetical protein
MKTICPGWEGLTHTPALLLRDDGTNDGRTSHGACHECAARLNGDLREPVVSYLVDRVAGTRIRIGERSVAFVGYLPIDQALRLGRQEIENDIRAGNEATA